LDAGDATAAGGAGVAAAEAAAPAAAPLEAAAAAPASLVAPSTAEGGKGGARARAGAMTRHAAARYDNRMQRLVWWDLYMFTAAAVLFTLLAARCALALATGTEAGGLEGELDGSGGGGGGGGSEGGGGGEGGGGTVIGGWVLADTWTDAEAALALLGTRALWTDWRLEVRGNRGS